LQEGFKLQVKQIVPIFEIKSRAPATRFRKKEASSRIKKMFLTAPGIMKADLQYQEQPVINNLFQHLQCA